MSGLRLEEFTGVCQQVGWSGRTSVGEEMTCTKKRSAEPFAGLREHKVQSNGKDGSGCSRRF